MEYIRQGDLLFIPTETVPEGAKKRKSGILAEGEATGHAHRIATLEAAQVWAVDDWRGEEVYVRVTEDGVSVVHEEHGPVELAPGMTYHVHRAREFDYLAQHARTVLD